jgi:pyridoxal 5'-phosphate synthase pdxS subunit
MDEIRKLSTIDKSELMAEAKRLQAPFELVTEVSNMGKLRVVNFAAGGIATPADAALMMQLGADGVFVGSGIFKSENPQRRARAIVEATTHYDNAEILVKVSQDLGVAMHGLDIKNMDKSERLAVRGW